MKSLFTVIGFTIKDMVKRKSFIISNLIIFLIIIVGFNVPNWISGESFKTEKLTILDNENIFEGKLDNLNEELSNLGYEIEVDKTSTIEEIQNKIKNEEIPSALILTQNENGLSYEYLVDGMGLTTTVPTDVISAIQLTYQNMQLAKLGIPEENLPKINSEANNIKVTSLSSEEQGSNIFIMMLLSIVLFYAIYFYAYQVSTAITVEKTSRIIETLVTSTSPRIIVLGKTIGIGIVGIMQTLLTILVAVICAKAFLAPEMVSSIFEMMKLSPEVIVVIAIYYLLGYSLYALLYALTGSTVSKPEEVQSANGPVAILAVIGFYLSYFTMMNPSSNLNEIAALVPISSPFCMPFRVMMGLSTMNELVMSIMILIITIILVAKISIKIYSSAILNYGEKISIKKLLKQ